MNGNVRGVSGRVRACGESTLLSHGIEEPVEQPEAREDEHEEHECDQVAGPGRGRLRQQ